MSDYTPKNIIKDSNKSPSSNNLLKKRIGICNGC